MDEIQEITEQLLRFSPDALIVVDSQGLICFANETVGDVFGYAPKALTGQSMEVLIPPRLRCRHFSHVMEYMKDPRNREMGTKISDLYALRADGSEFAAGIRLAPFRAGGKCFVAAAIRDMTEQRQVNVALTLAQDEAVRANRAKSRFLATASHDLRQPLQAIRLINASLIKMAQQEHAHDLVARCEELLRCQEQAIEGMARLLNSLLEISRLESGAVKLVSAPTSIADIFTELHAEFDSVARVRGISLQISSVDQILNTDRTLFHQLLQNLVGNAIKYTNEGKVSITCQLETSDSLVITVSDTGIGIPEDKLDRIFDEYYQIDGHGGGRMGVGLGLAIVKEAARLLGFTVEITSRVGSGTQAHIRIPKRLLIAERQVAESVPVRSMVPTYKARVVLVEDNDGVRMATELFLKLEGYETFSAGSVAEVEQLLSSITCNDLIITDYHLDGRSTGLDVLKLIRKQLVCELPGIVLSGDLQSVLRGLKEPVPNCRFLSKPVDTKALLATIDELSIKLPDANS